jgi:hypothetical protein
MKVSTSVSRSSALPVEDVVQTLELLALGRAPVPERLVVGVLSGLVLRGHAVSSGWDDAQAIGRR